MDGKRKYVIKNPQPRKTHQLNTILNDAQYEVLKKYRDAKYPGMKLSSVLRELVNTASLALEIEKTAKKSSEPRYLGDIGK